MDIEEKVAHDTIRIDTLPLTVILQAVLKMPSRFFIYLGPPKKALLKDFIRAYETKLRWYHYVFCPGFVARHTFVHAAEPVLRQYARFLLIPTHNPVKYRHFIRTVIRKPQYNDRQILLALQNKTKQIKNNLWSYFFQRATYKFLEGWLGIINVLTGLIRNLPLILSRQLRLMCRAAYLAERNRAHSVIGNVPFDAGTPYDSDTENNAQRTIAHQNQKWIKRCTACMTDLAPLDPYEGLLPLHSELLSRGNFDPLVTNLTFSENQPSIATPDYYHSDNNNNGYASDESSILSATSPESTPF